MKKITVVHMAEALELGGMERVIAGLAKGLDKNLYDVIVCGISRGGRVADELKAQGVEVRVLNIDSYYNPLNILRVSRFLKEVGADIVHTHTYFSGVLARIAAKMAGKPLLFHHVHSSYWGYSKRNLLIERILSRSTEMVICVSNAVRDFVVEREKIDKDKTVVIYNGINTGCIPCERVVCLGTVTVVSVGSFSPHKGQRFLIEAIAILRDKGVPVSCILVGSGSEEGALRRLVEELSLGDSVEFRGICDSVNDVLVSSDIFVMPSVEREGLGLALLEAMACGKPVIASRLGGIPEIVVDGENGLLVDPEDPVALAAAIEKLLSNTDIMKGMGRRGRTTVEEKFSLPQMVNSVSSIYKERIKANSGK